MSLVFENPKYISVISYKNNNIYVKSIFMHMQIEGKIVELMAKLTSTVIGTLVTNSLYTLRFGMVAAAYLLLIIQAILARVALSFLHGRKVLTAVMGSIWLSSILFSLVLLFIFLKGTSKYFSLLQVFIIRAVMCVSFAGLWFTD